MTLPPLGVDSRGAAPTSCRHDTSTQRSLMAPAPNRPLAGIVVLDFGQVYQGPYATLLMAKAGASTLLRPCEQGAKSPFSRAAARPIPTLPMEIS